MVWYTHVAARFDGELLAVASSDGWLGVWLPLDNRIVAAHQLGSTIHKLAWTADGALLVATCGDALHVFDGDGTDRLGTIETGHGGLRWFATHPAQPIVATTGHDGRTRLWDVATRAAIREVLADHAKSSGTAIELTERAVIVGYESGRFSACEHDDKWITSGRVFEAYVSALAASPDGSSVLAASGKGRLFRMDTTQSGWPDREAWTHPPKPISTNTIAFAADGRFVTALSDDTAVVYRGFDDAIGTTLGHPSWLDKQAWEQAFIVSAACFVPRTPIVATSHFTGHVKLWRGGSLAATIAFDEQPRWTGVADPIAAWSELAKT